jgi:hypothetical protein
MKPEYIFKTYNFKTPSITKIATSFSLPQRPSSNNDGPLEDPTPNRSHQSYNLVEASVIKGEASCVQGDPDAAIKLATNEGQEDTRIAQNCLSSRSLLPRSN